jgi:hypothetical protein
MTNANDNNNLKPTFVCKDCGCDVYDALGEIRERCHTCTWIAEIPDEEDREKIRRLMGL